MRKIRNSYNLIGEKFGKLTVISESNERYISPNGKKHKKWNCVCDCGRSKIVTTNNLCMGNSSSCGCSYYNPIAMERRAKGRIKELSGLVEIYGSYKRNAKKRGYNFELTFEDAEDITKRNCYYCNKKPLMVITKSSVPYFYNGIDRIDNTKGYELSNVVPCCKNCNKAKMDLTYEEFLEMINNIYNNLIK